MAGRDVCAACGADCAEAPVEACLACGSFKRNHLAYAQVAEGWAEAHDPQARVREPRPEYRHGRVGQPAIERRAGLSVTWEDGMKRYVSRTFDRVADVYQEVITDPDGSVYRYVREPLSRHRNTAKG